jgi:hypothetical protein
MAIPVSGTQMTGMYCIFIARIITSVDNVSSPEENRREKEQAEK